MAYKPPTPIRERLVKIAVAELWGNMPPIPVKRACVACWVPGDHELRKRGQKCDECGATLIGRHKVDGRRVDVVAGGAGR
jgi:hypothetical protein